MVEGGGAGDTSPGLASQQLALSIAEPTAPAPAAVKAGVAAEREALTACPDHAGALHSGRRFAAEKGTFLLVVGSIHTGPCGCARMV